MLNKIHGIQQQSYSKYSEQPGFYHEADWTIWLWLTRRQVGEEIRCSDEPAVPTVKGRQRRQGRTEGQQKKAKQQRNKTGSHSWSLDTSVFRPGDDVLIKTLSITVLVDMHEPRQIWCNYGSWCSKLDVKVPVAVEPPVVCDDCDSNDIRTETR